MALFFNNLGVTARVVLSALNPRKKAWDFHFHHSRDTLDSKGVCFSKKLIKFTVNIKPFPIFHLKSGVFMVDLHLHLAIQIKGLKLDCVIRCLQYL